MCIGQVPFLAFDSPDNCAILSSGWIFRRVFVDEIFERLIFRIVPHSSDVPLALPGLRVYVRWGAPPTPELSLFSSLSPDSEGIYVVEVPFPIAGAIYYVGIAANLASEARQIGGAGERVVRIQVVATTKLKDSAYGLKPSTLLQPYVVMYAQQTPLSYSYFWFQAPSDQR